MKFNVYWSKAYYMSGEVIVEADSAEDAYQIVDCNIGDYDGNMQYNPIDNIIEVGDELPG